MKLITCWLYGDQLCFVLTSLFSIVFSDHLSADVGFRRHNYRSESVAQINELNDSFTINKIQLSRSKYLPLSPALIIVLFYPIQPENVLISNTIFVTSSSSYWVPQRWTQSTRKLWKSTLRVLLKLIVKKFSFGWQKASHYAYIFGLFLYLFCNAIFPSWRTVVGKQTTQSGPFGAPNQVT